MTAQGHTFDVLNNNDTGVHSGSMATLDMYTHVILHKHDRTLTSAEESNLRRWIDEGGRLLVTGYDSIAHPTDPALAAILNCSSPADGPFVDTLTVTSVSHPILWGPAQMFTAGEALTASTTDHDSCTLGPGAVSLVNVGTASKLFITEGIGPGRGMVAYWSGNGTEMTDWSGTGGTQPALQNLFVNLIEYMCSAP